ncbi:hypothetical protein K432DRAFT_311344, partial [Lepidopterella palustris CBS 459.81]
VMALLTDNSLLVLKCGGSENAVVNKKRRPERGKSLLLVLPFAQDGGTIFHRTAKV